MVERRKMSHLNKGMQGNDGQMMRGLSSQALSSPKVNDSQKVSCCQPVIPQKRSDAHSHAQPLHLSSTAQQIFHEEWLTIATRKQKDWDCPSGEELVPWVSSPLRANPTRAWPSSKGFLQREASQEKYAPDDSDCLRKDVLGSLLSLGPRKILHTTGTQRQFALRSLVSLSFSLVQEHSLYIDKKAESEGDKPSLEQLNQQENELVFVSLPYAHLKMCFHMTWSGINIMKHCLHCSECFLKKKNLSQVTLISIIMELSLQVTLSFTIQSQISLLQ